MTITTADAAARLGVKESEIASAEHAPEGALITTTAGVRYVDVPEDRPDGEGKTGLMYRTLPDPDRVYSFPCFVPPVEDLEDLVEAEADTEGADEDVPDGSIDDVLAWVADDPGRARVALAAELDRPKPRKTLVEDLEDLVEDQADTDGDDA